MTTQRAPRQMPDPDETPSPSARRLLYKQALRASEQLHEPQGSVALVLIDVSLAPGSEHLGERVLPPVTSKLASLVNRRLRSVDLLVRSAHAELAVLLSFAHIAVAAAFSERLRQPIEHALREMSLADQIVVGMGLAANPVAQPWHPEALIALADFRMLAARSRARASPNREWALAADGGSMPWAWADAGAWPATVEITSHSGV
ncbi:MAG: diguanylate cyclase [Burkholderiales bacterium]